MGFDMTVFKTVEGKAICAIVGFVLVGVFAGQYVSEHLGAVCGLITSLLFVIVGTILTVMVAGVAFDSKRDTTKRQRLNPYNMIRVNLCGSIEKPEHSWALHHRLARSRGESISYPAFATAYKKQLFTRLNSEIDNATKLCHDFVFPGTEIYTSNYIYKLVWEDCERRGLHFVPVVYDKSDRTVPIDAYAPISIACLNELVDRLYNNLTFLEHVWDCGDN